MFTAGECRLVCTSSAVLVKEKLKVFTVFSLCLCMDIIVFVETRSWNLFLAEFNPFAPDFLSYDGKNFIISGRHLMTLLTHVLLSGMMPYLLSPAKFDLTF